MRHLHSIAQAKLFRMQHHLYFLQLHLEFRLQPK
jgi:hypothetical protein